MSVKAFVRAKAVLWLHTIRLWRFRWSFLNWILSDAAWIFLFVLGALLFVPREQLSMAVKGAFWTIVAWSVISNFSSLIGSWMNFFISIGMVEEHLVRGFSPFKALLGRLITGSSITIASLLFMAMLVGGAFHVDLLSADRTWLLVLGLGLLAVEGISYGFTVAAISMRTSVPNNLLEILNLGIIGLLMVPVQAIPGSARLAYLCIPYVAPSHLMKVATSSALPMLLEKAVLISALEATAMFFVALFAMRLVEVWIKRNGVKAIGFW